MDLTGFLLTHLLFIRHLELSERGRELSDGENSKVEYTENHSRQASNEDTKQFPLVDL
jgi:hypothetical protein